jgi:cbb3-type cytochrome oxidase subunit 3
LRVAAALALPALFALRLATSPPAVVGIDAVDEAVRVWVVTVVLFAVAGLGVTRLLLPESLRRHELLWVLPTGAASLAIAMTPLGFATIPFRANLAITLIGFLALDVYAVRRNGWPARPRGERFREVAWPLYIGALLAAVALIPMFRSGFATVVGTGSDAHMATGSAEFLRHEPPLGTNIDLPVDTWWPTWRSKQAIYYAFAAVTEFTGFETYEVISALASILLALAAIGFYLVARELLGATVGTAVVAVGIAALSRMVLHTAMHPYFNQTWGLVALPFCFVLGWVAIRNPSRGTLGLLGLFLALEGLAYPVALPIPLLFLAVVWWFDRRERRARGEHVFTFEVRAWWRRLRASPRKLRYPAYVLAFFCIIPAWGVLEKITGATQLAISPNQSLALWGGDLTGYYPERQFFSIAQKENWWGALLVVAGFALWFLAKRLPRPLAAGLLAVFAAATFLAVEMRFRTFGYYFHFKILAFAAPLFVLCAAVAMRQARTWGVVLLTVWSFWALLEARDEITTTFDELPQTVLALRDWSDRIPEGASIRFDMEPGSQLWPGYLLADHPVCSQRPLHNTAYPHVKLSRAADYALARRTVPFDAVGPPVMENAEFRLFKLRPGLPGGDRCSREMVQTVTKIERG